MYALIRHKQFGADAEITFVGSEWEALNRWEASDFGNDGWFYSVRPVDHELTQTAAKQMLDRLTPKPRMVLQALVKATEPGRSIKPGNRKRGATDGHRFEHACRSLGLSIYTGDVVPHARKLAAVGLVRIDGLDFAPKTYTPTPIGRVVGSVA